ncbi:MAG: hypothetical protein COT74_09720 [Bdellovibrionales bacterium CG10_big_fil_rev_8_21_14_0_10_45_34]|nr:MAG: hypothetical protein COT74_09720 [Bdellovibrionales bacterium CG10_big_fil_rev_8_21_14_0_10_45_34]
MYSADKHPEQLRKMQSCSVSQSNFGGVSLARLETLGLPVWSAPSAGKEQNKARPISIEFAINMF